MHARYRPHPTSRGTVRKMTTSTASGDGSHGGGVPTHAIRRDPSRSEVEAVVDFALLTALDPGIAATAIHDALVVLASRLTTAAPTVEPLVVLAHARAEVWRQLRAREVHPDTAPEVLVDAEPLEALTPMERTVLFLCTRKAMSYEDAGFIMDLSPKAVRRLRRNASVALVRSVTALALAMDLTPCPIRDGIAARGAGFLNRKDIDALTMHAAECSICVEWLRKADHHAIDGYSKFAGPSDHEINVVVANLVKTSDDERARVVGRAGVLRKDGRPPRGSRLETDPQRWLKRATIFAIISVLFVLTGLMALNL